jgi:hypothetical protein
MQNETISGMTFQRWFWLATIPEVDMVPANRKTATIDSPMPTS